MVERLWFIISCFFMISFSFTESQVSFTSTYNYKVIGVVGTQVNFTWSYTGNVRAVELSKGNQGLIVIDKTSKVSFPTASYEGRINVVWSRVSPGLVTFLLNLTNITEEGTYKCILSPQASDGIGPTEKVTLVVFELPNILALSVRDNYEEGSLVNITCKSRGKPQPLVKWLRKGISLSSGNTTASLIFENISRNDDGNYSCQASNDVGGTDSFITLVVTYPPTVQDITASSNKSWIGQRVTLTCVSDGVPIPTLTWYKPNGSELKKVRAKENKALVTLRDDQDFGGYKCIANNKLTPNDERMIKIDQIKKPGLASILSEEEDIQASSLTVRWTAPTVDGGSPITGYRVIILKGGTKIGAQNITDPGQTSHTFSDLERDTNFTVKVLARNFVFEGDAAVKTIRTKFQGVPAIVEIDDLPSETRSDEITLSWKEPENNGKKITVYIVYQRIVTDGKGGGWKIIKKMTANSVRELQVQLEKGKEYEFAITAKNAFGEGLKQDESRIRSVKAIGIPGIVEIYDLPFETSDDAVTLKWKKPEINGKEITEYTVYRRTVTDGSPGKWMKLKETSDVKVRELRVKLERGKVYEFAVTATNGVGESLKPDGRNIPQVKALGSPVPTKGSPVGGENGMNTAIYSGAAVAGVLLIIGIIVIIVLWRRRKPSSADNDGIAMDGLGTANHYEANIEYQEVSGAEAARRLQATGPEVNYAQVDMTKKKKNRPPPSDEYAQVDKSKKTKKRPKRPGELDYADLEDLRVGLVPGPSGANAAAAVVRPPAYEGTDYADITQFGVSQPDPTYANVSKGDVTYSNMQSM